MVLEAAVAGGGHTGAELGGCGIGKVWEAVVLGVEFSMHFMPADGQGVEIFRLGVSWRLRFIMIIPSLFLWSMALWLLMTKGWGKVADALFSQVTGE